MSGELWLRYWGSFFFTAALCAALQYYGRNSSNGGVTSSAASSRFTAFQRNYLAVFLLAMFSDWL